MKWLKQSCASIPSVSSVFRVQSALLFWIVLLIPAGKPEIRLALASLGCLWIFWRTPRWKTLLILMTFCMGMAWNGQRLNDPFVPEDGIYSVIRIRSGYAIAENGFGSVLVYEPQDLFPDQKISLSGFKPIHTLNNPEVFSFQKFMEEKGVQWAAEKWDPVDQTPETLKGRVWRWISEHPASRLYKMLFYGISERDSLAWIGSLGLGLIALCQVIRKIVSRFVLPAAEGWILLGVQLLILLLFPVSVSLIRLTVFSLARQLNREWKVRWPLSVSLFLLLVPEQAGSLAFVLPAGISFLHHFASVPFLKKAVSMMWGAFCQMLYMNQVSLPFLCFFTRLRSAFGWFCLISLPGLLLCGWGLFLDSQLEKIPFDQDWMTIQGIPPDWYVLLMAAGLIWLLWRQKKSRTGIVCLLFGLYPWIWKFDPFFHVYQLHVGQGDAAVIVEPFGRRVIMIDAAGRFNRDLASDLYVPFFRAHQIEAVDSLIVSHSDFDHDGSVESLQSQFPIRQIVRDSMAAVKSGSGLQLLLQERKAVSEDPNDASLIVHFAVDGFRYLYTGDASVRIEQELTDQYALDVDVLKLGHHGSYTSSSPAFLQETSPRLALISCGKNNRYGHPAAEVLAEMNLQGIDRLSTADHGQIHLFSLPGILFFSTADGLCGWMEADI